MPGSCSVVGAAESTSIGKVPEMSSVGLAIDGALNAMEDAGLSASDIDGLCTGYLPPSNFAMQMGIRPKWVDNTVVGGCSWMFHVHTAVAAINAGYCNTVLIAYGESGRSHRTLPNAPDYNIRGSIEQQFSMPYSGPNMSATLFALPLLRYMRDFGLTEEQLAMVAVIQREWASKNPRAKLREPTTVDEVLSSPMVADPIRRSLCCLVSDAGGSIILTSSERAEDFPKKPVHILGSGTFVETAVVLPTGVANPLEPDVVRQSGKQAFASAGVGHSDIDHLMIYDAFAHTPIFGLEGLGFTRTGESGGFIADGNTRRNGRLPMNTNGGGLCYAHSGCYGMLCMLESIRQIRGEAAAQVDGVNTSLVHGWGGFWSAAATLIFSSERP